MTNTPRKRIQERGARLLALSMIAPICVFLFAGYMMVNYIISEKDDNNLRNLARTMKQLDTQRLNQYLVQHQVIADSLLRLPRGQRSDYLETLPEGSARIVEAHVFHDSLSLQRSAGLPETDSAFLYSLFYERERGVGYLKRYDKNYILSFAQLERPSEFMVILWRYATFDNIYQHALKSFELLDIDYDFIMRTSPELNVEKRRLLRLIFSSPDQIHIETERPSDLVAYYFIEDLTGRPLSIATMRTERYYLTQMRRLFWMGGSVLSLMSILLAVFLSHKTANFIVNPIEKLALEMNSIASDPIGSEELSHRSHPELEMVVNSFNGILRSFKSYYESVLRYRMIVTNLQEGIFWSDERGRIIISNAAFMRIFDRQSDSLPDLFFWKKGDIHNRMAQFFEGREFVIGERTYLMFVNEISIEDQPNFLGLISDVTQQKEHEEARKSLELELAKARTLADLGLLIEGISHNLNGPLHNILGYVHLLLENDNENRDLKRIQANGVRMAEIIKSLMNRMGEEMVFAPRPIDINDLVRREIDFFDHNLYFKNIVRKRFELSEDLPLVMAVYSDISQTVANLVSNAVDALKESPRKELLIRTHVCEEGLCISVNDTGVGIPPEKLETIFESFYSTKTQDDTTGRGLGLSISRQLLSAYGAHLEVESKPGAGSTFTIVIPRERFAPEGAVAESGEREL